MFEVRKPAYTHINDFSEGEGRVRTVYLRAFLRYYHAAFMPVFPTFGNAGFFILVYRVATLNINIFLGELAK